MRIAYFAHLNDGRASGVVSKIAAQVAYWRSKEHSVRLFVATTDGGGPWLRNLGDIVVCQYGGPLSRLTAMTRAVRALRAFDPDLVYVRADLYYPSMAWFPADVPMVVEVNSDDLKEDLLGSRIRATYNACTRGFLLKRANAMVFVTTELSHLASFSRFAARHCVISNGIDLAAYPELSSEATGPPRLAFVGSGGAPWHGVDKLTTLAAMRADWRIDIVGAHEGRDGSPPNITWHGTLERADVLAILARADVGVGTLALHRNSMNEASTLKVREYLAVGLPALYGYSDPDTDQLAPYTLRIANTEKNVIDELPRIEAFVDASRGTRVPRAILAHLDIGQKEGQRLALFEDLAGV